MRLPLTALAMLALGVASSASADTGGNFPGAPADSRTLRVQEKVDSLFEAGEYDRARFIYENELAPIGDKYAQYMLGYMHLTGTGVEENPALASAWYRLAAERGNSKFSAVRDQLMETLDAAELARSDAYFGDLLEQYSDAVILLRLIRTDLNRLEDRTGTRLGGDGAAVTVIDPKSGSSLSADYFRSLEDRTAARIEYLNAILGVPDDANVDVREIDPNTLEERVDRYIERIRKR